jgi:hypothetical protein
MLVLSTRCHSPAASLKVSCALAAELSYRRLLRAELARLAAGRYPYRNAIPKQIVDIFERTDSSGAGAGITTTPCISNTVRS